ncbi:transcription termination factor NusA [Patescibacteria group bacterium]
MTKVSEISLAIKQICEEKKISYESVITTVEAALAVAYRKDFGEKNQNIIVEFDADTGGARVFDEKKVVANELKEKWEKEKAEREAQAEEEAKAEVAEIKEDKDSKKKTEEVKKDDEQKSEDTEEEVEDRYDPKSMFSLSEAKEIKKDAKLDDVIRTELFPPAAYGRMAAQTAKQVIIQKLREAERENLYNEFKDKEGSVINATIQRVEGRMVLIDLGATTALMPPGEQIPDEQYTPGQRIKIYVISVTMSPKGPEIIVSRAKPEMVAQLFAMEVPEISAGSVEIKAVAREAGSRTKVAVFSSQKNIDPVGSCVGQRGSRVQTIITELGGEKIDIIEYNEDPVNFITNALSPAKVLAIKLNDEERVAIAEVKEDQLSLAIGKAGQNVRLAARLTGWKIDITSEGKNIESKSPEDGESGESEEGETEKGSTTDDEVKDESKNEEPAEEKANEKSAEKPPEPKTEENDKKAAKPESVDEKDKK